MRYTLEVGLLLEGMIINIPLSGEPLRVYIVPSTGARVIILPLLPQNWCKPLIFFSTIPCLP